MKRLLELTIIASLSCLSPLGGCNDATVYPTDGGRFDAIELRDAADIILPDGPLCPASAVFDAGSSVASVTMAGSFNGWDEAAAPLARGDDGLWRVELALPAGHYPFKFVVDGVFEAQTPPDVLSHWSDGVENRDLAVADCTLPSWSQVQGAITADGILKVSARFNLVQGAEGAGDGAALDRDSVVVTVAGEPAAFEVKEGDGFATITVDYAAGALGKYSVRIRAADGDGRRPERDELFVPLWHEGVASDDAKARWRWRDASIYLVFVDRFRDTDGVDNSVDGVAERANYQGGDYRGVIEAIEGGYFDTLGVNTLWLSPVYQNTDTSEWSASGSNLYAAYHGYWPTSADRAESRFGDAEMDADGRLKQLIDAAHARGMRIIFDTVLNHVHEAHDYCVESPDWCQATCVCGQDGCGWDDKPLTCQFAEYLPDMNYRDHAIVRRVVRDTLAWGETLDVDGYRVDAAKHMDHIIMRTLATEARGRYDAVGAAPTFFLGETFTGGDGYRQIMQYVAPWELDGQFDFPLMYAARAAFVRDGSFRDLEAAVARSESEYGDAIWSMSPFVGNHDISRTATEIAGNDLGPWGDAPDLMAQGPQDTVTQWEIINRMSMATAWLMGVKGLPLTYYGDEVGLAGSGDPDNRRFMPSVASWNANQRQLHDRVAAMGRARRDTPALRRGERKELWIDDSFYVFGRYLDGTPNKQLAVVAMNKGAEPRTETITLPAAWSPSAFEGQTLASVDSERAATISGGRFSITLDPWEYAIFTVIAGP